MKLLCWFVGACMVVVLCCILANFFDKGINVPAYPPSVDVTTTFTYKNPWEQPRCPLINMNKYLKHLSNHVGKESQSSVSVIVGPKNAGKSKGLAAMIEAWKIQGHTVINIDLKGKPYRVTSDQVLGLVMKKIYQVFQREQFDCLYEYTIQKCSHVHVPSGLWWNIQQIWSNYGSKFISLESIVALGAVVLPVVTKIGLCVLKRQADQTAADTDNHQRHNDNKCMNRTFVVMTITFVVIIVCAIAPNRVGEFLKPINETISNGDWETLVCVCNSIAMCVPQHRPILIVREFANFEQHSLESLLRSFEHMKQDDKDEVLNFPVIFETPDFLWLNESSVIRSSASFQAYLLEEMSYSEGKEELVGRYEMFTQEEFDKIYAALGGHTGSYAILWDKIRYAKFTIDEAIMYLRECSYDHLLSCLSQQFDNEADVKQVNEFLCELKEGNYTIQRLIPLPAHVQQLIDCNILFVKGDIIYPQIRLLQHAIENYLNKFSNQCTKFSHH